MGEPELFGRPRWKRRLTAVRERWLRTALVSFLLVDLTILGVDGYLLDNRSVTTVVDLDDALVTFRSGSGGVTTTTSAPAGGAEVSGAATGALTGAPVAVPTTVPGSTSSTPVPTSAPAAPMVGALAPPPPGVYRYRTTGGENVSLLGAKHDYPRDTYAVVRQTGGCGWEMRSEVVKEHVDRRLMCSDGTRLLQMEQERAVTFFGTTDGGTIRCDPPQVQMATGEAVGATSVSSCSDGKGADARMARRTLAFGRAEVGGVLVDTVTFRIVGTMTGRVRGTSSDTYTVVRSTGLPISVDRTVDTMADAFGTSVRYQEHATFDLVSLDPQT